MRSGSSRGVAVARFVSIAGHPFVLVPSAILVSGTSAQAVATPRAALFVAIVVVLGMIAIGAYVASGLRAGRFADVDVSVREQRGGLYRVSLAATAAATAVFHFGDQPAIAVRGSGIAFVLVGCCALANLRTKISLHVAFAAYAVGIAGGRRPAVLAVAALIALAVAWSRVVLRRHTRAEVVAGGIAGAAAAAAFVLA